MSLIEQSDVKNHLYPRLRTEIHLCPPVSQADGTGYSVSELGPIEANPSNSPEDSVAEHSSSGTDLAQGHPLVGAIDPQSPATSKSVQR
jgi:hypothetical protein